jgi:hypothetical protein
MENLNTSLFELFYNDLLTIEKRLISRRKRIEENMSKQNNKLPVIDVYGRYHAPCDGYQWTDGNTQKKFLGGEYLPVDDFTEENNYYKLSKIHITEIIDIPSTIIKDMINLGFTEVDKIFCIKRYNNDQEHINGNNIKVVTCEIKTTQWHFNHFCQFIKRNSISINHKNLYKRTNKEEMNIIALDSSGKINYILNQSFENNSKYIKFKYINGNNYENEYYEFINECTSEKLNVKNCRLCKFYKKHENEKWEIFCLKNNYNCRDTEAIYCKNFENIKL